MRDALVSGDSNRNCISRDGTSLIIVTKDKLQEVLDIIKNGGKYDEK